MIDEATEESGDDEHTVSRQSKRRRDGAGSGGASKNPKHEDAHEIPEDVFLSVIFNILMFKIVQVRHCKLNATQH